MAFRQLRSVRALHTTPLARQSAAEITSDFLARLTADSNGRNAGQSQANTAARGMIGSVGLRHSASEDGRRQFRPNEFAEPHVFKESDLYPTQKPRPKAPLLGPSKRVAKQIDPFFIRKSNALDHSVNPLMSMAFIDSFGRIKGRNETGLTWRSQKMVGKMVRRARAMGVIPHWANRPAPGGLGERDFNRFRGSRN
ncbi:hypothetical protein CcaverHIS002_0408040 [Cutaneotrichosporon cavernicola]|uniref:Small ribosomal subunit protein bS18m n=1 Tax=Cutaneotrichosporon cavernicola TaxID=279322 RepID=A0AA48QWB0_9TREE|nr:uncharacterized protein CcaverHIS019_0408020 [Cutaneotrichosporon cavernicola]BEI84200.1 hypothetical protein CcaverHIS002_0408040 [Cutaneotrichosporon cavernicola]BEI91982.1 hypothetical protein CcaverHIS019_0408020 [Cutaneotrichosporon cavernicola]BEI99753.1 hypothetical protein CcaverHIS631_0407960 [Cutaneotrichosporon cavernicola]BEJ07529.1 hypothetical protein CcaverHIS641_0407980 [Cutaneotrichosporon cavernicola]